MSNQLNPLPIYRNIFELYQAIKSSQLILQPYFQRRLVWTDKDKENFIDTILQGYPFPEIYLATLPDETTEDASCEVIVDGQQRLNAIISYIDGQEKFLSQVPTFDSLTEEERKAFLDYNVVIRNLGEVDEEHIKEVFRRINATKHDLENIEIQNAIYNGEFITVAKEILDTTAFNEIVRMSATSITRMSDLEFVLLLLATIEHGGYFSDDEELEDCIIRYNNIYPNKEEVKQRFIKTIDWIQNLALAQNSIWLNKANFFTLFVELYKNLPKRNELFITQQLLSFEQSLLSIREINEEAENPYIRYQYYLTKNVNKRKARVKRAEILNEVIFNPTNEEVKINIINTFTREKVIVTFQAEEPIIENIAEEPIVKPKEKPSKKSNKQQVKKNTMANSDEDS